MVRVVIRVVVRVNVRVRVVARTRITVRISRMSYFILNRVFTFRVRVWVASSCWEKLEGGGLRLGFRFWVVG